MAKKVSAKAKLEEAQQEVEALRLGLSLIGIVFGASTVISLVWSVDVSSFALAAVGFIAAFSLYGRRLFKNG